MKQAFAGMLLAAAFAMFGFALYNTAWLSDDAYISYRTVDNLVHGYGLTWNVAERVQAFTNPLWVLLNAVPYAFVQEPWHIYFSALAVSAVVSLIAIFILAAGVARSAMAAVFAIVALSFCRAFVDYSTSGLENPMTHLLLALFMLYFLRLRWTMGVLFSMSLCAGLSMVNRMDTLLLFAPVLIYAWLAERNVKATLVMLAGALPFIAWEIFSVIYYGFPFPNTAYAKLGTGIGDQEIVMQGLWYLANSIKNDPLTLALIACGLVGAPLALRNGRYTALALGGLLYVVYVVKVGGDFMQGRFLAAPLFLAVLLLVQLQGFARPAAAIAAALVAVALSMQAPHAPLLTDDAYLGSKDFKDEHGIGDERKYYMGVTGLRFWDGRKELPTHSYAQMGRDGRAEDRYFQKTHGAIGFRGFFYGPKVLVVDHYALADPLLARIPAYYHPDWRIGHFSRHVPAWYRVLVSDRAARLQADFKGQPALDLAAITAAIPPHTAPEATAVEGRPDPNSDADLQQYYAKLDLITRGPLWSAERWRAIVDMNLGRYNGLIHEDSYRFPQLTVRTLDSINTPKAAGAAWDAPGNLRITSGVAEIQLGGLVHNAALELSGDHNDDYRLIYMRAGQVIGESDVPAMRQPGGGLRVFTVTLPNDVIRAGYDAVRIKPYGGDTKSAIGHLRLL